LPNAQLHPFDRRNIHPGLPPKTRKLFDDGHFAEATFHAFKFLDKLVQKHSSIKDTGFALMMAAFNEGNPKIVLTPLKEISEVDEQKGFRFLFAGSVSAIRNPRGHEFDMVDDPSVSNKRRSQAATLRVSLGRAAGCQETRDVRKPVLRRPH
jgi:uncharacterized protein (TIGR02391 family)